MVDLSGPQGTFSLLLKMPIIEFFKKSTKINENQQKNVKLILKWSLWSQFSFSGLVLQGNSSGNQFSRLVKFQEQRTSARGPNERSHFLAVPAKSFVTSRSHRAHSGPVGPSGPGGSDLKMAITSSIFIFRASPWNLCMKTCRDDSNKTNPGKIGALWVFPFFGPRAQFLLGLLWASWARYVQS